MTRGAWALARGVGTPLVSIPLAVVAGAFVIAEPLVRSANDGRWSLAETWSWWVLVWAVVLDAAVGLVRALPYRQRQDGVLERRAIGPGTLGGLLGHASWLLAALALLLSSGWRDRMEFRVAQGEAFTASPDQLVARDPLRFGSRGPFPVDLVVERVEGGPWSSGTPPRAVVRGADGGVRSVGAVFPAWFGWGRYLRVSRVGPTLRCDVSRAGAWIDGVRAKLDLLGAPPQSEIRLERAPLRLLVAPVPAEPLAVGRPPALRASVHRGKLLVAEGEIRGGEQIEVEGLRVSFPEWSPWAQLELVRDPGLPLAILAALAALAALGASAAGRLRRRGPAAGTGGVA